jgi:galactokinase
MKPVLFTIRNETKSSTGGYLPCAIGVDYAHGFYVSRPKTGLRFANGQLEVVSGNVLAGSGLSAAG